MSLIRIFQIALKGGEGENTPSGGGIGNFNRGGFFSADEHLTRSAFDH